MTKAKISKWSQKAYSAFRRTDPYPVSRERLCLDLHFHNCRQEQIFAEIYATKKKLVVAPQKYINVTHMEEKHAYFGEALDIFQKFGLIPLMEHRQNYDVNAIAQFYSTLFIHMQSSTEGVLKWMTRKVFLTATWSEFAEFLVIPFSLAAGQMVGVFMVLKLLILRSWSLSTLKGGEPLGCES